MHDMFWEILTKEKEIVEDEYGELYIVFENVLVNLDEHKTGITIEDIISTSPHRGYASKALAEICKLADHLEIVLDLYPLPTRKKGLTCSQLEEWYIRYGFSPNNEWKRNPHHSFKSS